MVFYFRYLCTAGRPWTHETWRFLYFINLYYFRRFEILGFTGSLFIINRNIGFTVSMILGKQLLKEEYYIMYYLKTKTLGAALFCGNRTFLVLSRRHFELSRRHWKSNLETLARIRCFENWIHYFYYCVISNILDRKYFP